MPLGLFHFVAASTSSRFEQIRALQMEPVRMGPRMSARPSSVPTADAGKFSSGCFSGWVAGEHGARIGQPKRISFNIPNACCNVGAIASGWPPILPDLQPMRARHHPVQALRSSGGTRDRDQTQRNASGSRNLETCRLPKIVRIPLSFVCQP
jgi:hypothetical protein